MSLLGNSVALEFATLIYKKFCELGKPRYSNTADLKKFQASAVILFDRLVYEYSCRLWAGSGDSRLARDLQDYATRFTPVSTDEWMKVIDNFALGNASTVAKGIIYHYYCIKRMRPLLDGVSNATYDIDHIYAQAQFEHAVSIDKTLKESLGNKALLPTADNINKSDKPLNQLRANNWLYQQVLRYTGIAEEDVDKYSDITNINSLIEERINDYKAVFSNQRDSMLNNPF